MEKRAKVFSVLHGEISFTPEQMEYFDIRYKFEELAVQCRQQAQEEFYTRFNDYTSMVQGVEQWINEYLVRGATLSARILAEHEHYDLDPERFVAEYFDKARLNVASQHIRNFALAQQQEHDALEEARAERTEDAGNAWMGGGFGIKGALKGAVQAEALNLAGAALSETFNAIGRHQEGKRQKQEQDAFFADPETPKAFAAGIYCGLADMYIDLFKYVDKKCPEINIDYMTDEDVAKTESLLSNISKGIIPEAKIEEQCRRMLAMNPLYGKAYEYILAKFPDETASVVDLATFFRVREISRLLSERLDAYFKTLCVDSEKDVWESREKMAAYAAEIGKKDFESYPPLEELAAKFDKEYRTVEGIEYETRETADKQKSLLAYFNGLDLSGKYSEVESAIETLHAEAKKLGIDDGWLAERCGSALAASQERAKKALDDYYAALALDMEEQALAARKLLAEKAAELELHDFTAYPPLEAKLEEFDRQARTAGPRLFETREEARMQRGAYELYVSSGFALSEEKALLVKQQLEELARRDSIDVSWLTADVDKALTHFDEVARTAFDYRYATREECQRAAEDERLFFRAVWSRVDRYVRSNGIKRVGDYGGDVMKTVRKTLNLDENTPVFAYLSTEMIASGNAGLAFTPKGLYWSNGSALMSKIVSNKLVKALFSKKASELEEKNKIQSFGISWKDFLNYSAPLSGGQANMVQLDQNLMFEASRLNVNALLELLAQLRGWAKKSSIDFTDEDKPFTLNELQDLLPVTPLPGIQ